MDGFKFIHHFIEEIDYKDITDLDHNQVTEEFQKHLEEELNDDSFIELLIYSGFIPDVYPHDSSEEKLHTKLTESLLAEWARRLNLGYIIPTQKSGKEDVSITIEDNIVVADAKSFRLGRSQKAPNHKDFLKLESINSWMNNYSNSIGGLITFPHTHDWSTRSNVYEECTNKKTPTVILTYIYLAYILKNSNNFLSSDLLELWNYEEIFPEILRKKDGNRNEYWNRMNQKIIEVTNTDLNNLNTFVKKARSKKQKYIKEIVNQLENRFDKKTEQLYKELDQKTTKQIKKELVSLKIKKEEKNLKRTITRIKDFRLD